MGKRDKNDTPAMRQYRHFKRLHPDCVLFFRMGDFYEMFYEDAETANRVLGLTLTQRSEGIPMTGVPYHAVENYLRRMIEAGHRVAVCDQVEDAASAKGLVRRDVTRLITPGTLTDEALLEENRDNPLAALTPVGPAEVAVAWAELSTGSMSAATFGHDELVDELARIGPRELLLVEQDHRPADPDDRQLAGQIGAVATPRPAWQFHQDEAVQVIQQQFQVATLSGFGFEPDEPLLRPVGAIIHYLLQTQKQSDGSSRRRLAHLEPPKRFSRADHLIIDQVSLRSLEIDRTLRSGSLQQSLLGVLNECVTPMGKRTLRQWLCYPLRDKVRIEHRLGVVGALVADSDFLRELRSILGQIQDVARTSARLAVGRAWPRDLVGLGRSVAVAERLAACLADRAALRSQCEALGQVAGPLGELAGNIAAACIEAPPGHLRDGGLIRDGFDAQLDTHRHLERDSHNWLARYQKELIDQSQIQSLKVAYNKVFGYYIEVSAANRDRTPDHWSRKQTLKNAERYITPELKTFEDKVLGAHQRAVAREQALFEALCDEAALQVHHLHAFARTVAELDVAACFAHRAIGHRYVRPKIVTEPAVLITGGRHPVLDQTLGDRFVPNDLALGHAASQAPSGPDRPPTLALITGPNMAGKSTYIRQTALIVLLAHSGSFVPADSATIGLCDRIFTRIGASDELHAGRSTFMVEMTETANICHHASPASLVILDEIGRGTSTLDGLSLAWALAEHLAELGCRTLLATHYHELTQLSESLANVANLNVTVREWQDQIVFLHRIVAGAADRSYGIHVAKIAGVPQAVVQRANEVLSQLEVNHAETRMPTGGPAAPDRLPGGQLSLFTEYLPHPVIDELSRVDLDHLSPIQAMDALRRLAAMVGQDHQAPAAETSARSRKTARPAVSLAPDYNITT